MILHASFLAIYVSNRKIDNDQCVLAKLSR